VTSLDEEYKSALELIGSALPSQEILQSIALAAESLTKKAFEAPNTQEASITSKIFSILNRPDTQLILNLLGHEEVQQVIYKNCVLAFARILAHVRTIDSGSTIERLDPLIDLIAAVAPQAQSWACCHEETSHPIHDKKERLKRRRALLHEEQTQAQNATLTLLESLWSRFIPILLPKGAASLYLPKGGSLLLPSINKALGKPPIAHASLELAEKFIRESKVSFLYWLLSTLSQRLGSGKLEPPNYDLPIDRISTIESFLEPLRTAFLPINLSQETSAPPNAIASSIARTLLFLIEGSSLEFVFITGWLNVCGARHTIFHSESELETLIETLSHDDRIIRTILHLVTPTINLGLSNTKDLTASFWGMVMHGLTSSMTDIVIEDTLSSFDWESAQRMVLDRFRWFFYSPYGDRAISSWIKPPL
jgi:hypothetical protein